MGEGQNHSEKLNILKICYQQTIFISTSHICGIYNDSKNCGSFLLKPLVYAYIYIYTGVCRDVQHFQHPPLVVWPFTKCPENLEHMPSRECQVRPSVWLHTNIRYYGNQHSSSVKQQEWLFVIIWYLSINHKASSIDLWFHKHADVCTKYLLTQTYCSCSQKDYVLLRKANNNTNYST